MSWFAGETTQMHEANHSSFIGVIENLKQHDTESENFFALYSRHFLKESMNKLFLKIFRRMPKSAALHAPHSAQIKQNKQNTWKCNRSFNQNLHSLYYKIKVTARLQ